MTALMFQRRSPSCCSEAVLESMPHAGWILVRHMSPKPLCQHPQVKSSIFIIYIAA